MMIKILSKKKYNELKDSTRSSLMGSKNSFMYSKSLVSDLYEIIVNNNETIRNQYLKEFERLYKNTNDLDTLFLRFIIDNNKLPR